ncbi:MAG TPA: hypothetical protein VJB58_01390 [Candidatus Paceibacterota bacterium]
MSNRVSGNSPANESLVSYFEGLGIIPPPRTGGCLSLKHYLEHGYPGLHGQDKSERVAIIRSLQKQLVGKKVRIPFTQQVGRVSYITALSPQHMQEAMSVRKPGEQTPACLRFMIVGEDGKSLGLKIRSVFELDE